jgi:putative transposase
MKYNPSKHHRRSIRMKGYDYHTPGAYFVTICTKNREHVMDDPIVNAIVHDVWYALPTWFPTIELDEFIVMPNHTHFVVWNNVGTSLADVQKAGNVDGGKPRPHVIPQPQKTQIAPALGDIVGAFKSLVFKVYLDWIKANDPLRRAKFWQANYYEHIIRNDSELNAIRHYIIDNPINWEIDRDNLQNIEKLSPPEKVEDYIKDIEDMALKLRTRKA